MGFSIPGRNVSFLYDTILPGLPDDVAKYCFTFVRRPDFPAMTAVCNRWRSYIRSKEFITDRKLAGVREEFLYVAYHDDNKLIWELKMFDCLGHEHKKFTGLPGPKVNYFGMVALNGKLIVMGGVQRNNVASSDAYQYDPSLNRWSKLANMIVPRWCFGCAEVNGMIYVVDGLDCCVKGLSSVETYDPKANKWTLIETPRRENPICAAYGLVGKLYVIVDSVQYSSVDIYDPEERAWLERERRCGGKFYHVVIGDTIFWFEREDMGKLNAFKGGDNSWVVIEIPFAGAEWVWLGTLDGKLLLFSLSRIVSYDPSCHEWQVCDMKPIQVIATVTIESPVCATSTPSAAGDGVLLRRPSIDRISVLGPVGYVD